jgi:HlyD family type I secretion membrane fusion protein
MKLFFELYKKSTRIKNWKKKAKKVFKKYKKTLKKQTGFYLIKANAHSQKTLLATKSYLIAKFSYYFPKTKKYLDSKIAKVDHLFNKYLKLEEEQIGLRPIKYGLSITGLFAFLFFFCAGVLPINSSSIAQGTVVLDFARKTIQHLEGGIVQEILVKEGQKVATGTDLIVLQNIQAKAQQSSVQKQLLTSRAIYKRLIAEHDYSINQLDLSDINEQGRRLNYSQVEEIIKTQYNIYKIRKEGYFGKIEILKKRINQIEKEIDALYSQNSATDKQLNILRRELVMISKMVELRNIPITEQLTLEKQIAELEGKQGSLVAQSAKLEQSISETNLEIVNFSKEHLNSILAEMQEIETQISGLTEQLSSTSDILKRTVIKSPVSGIIMDLKFHNKGAVIPPGGEIMNVVPQDDELIVEAKINPKDIDVVKHGLKAKINFSAFKAKKVPKLDGEVVSVSADILFDELTGQTYFLGRIKISEDSLNSLKDRVQLYPGMPAEVFIITGSRTLLSYLISPIKDATYKAFRED